VAPRRARIVKHLVELGKGMQNLSGKVRFGLISNLQFTAIMFMYFPWDHYSGLEPIYH